MSPSSKAGSGDNAGRGDKAGGGKVAKPGRAARPGPDPVLAPNLRVQLPYFAARIAVLVLAVVVLLAVTNLAVVWVALVGLGIAGVTTYPLGRMQKKAAARAAAGPPSGR